MDKDFKNFKSYLTDEDYRDLMKPIDNMPINLPLSNAENMTDLINKLQMSQITTTLTILEKYHRWLSSLEDS